MSRASMVDCTGRNAAGNTTGIRSLFLPSDRLSADLEMSRPMSTAAAVCEYARLCVAIVLKGHIRVVYSATKRHSSPAL